MQPADRQPITSPVQIIAPLKSIFRSVTERSGEKNRFQFVRSLSISLYLSTRVCIYISIYPSFEDRSIPIPSIKSGSIKRHTLRWRPYGGANTHGVCGFGHTCRAEKRVSGAKFKYFSADGTTPACSATLRKFVPLRVRVCRT